LQHSSLIEKYLSSLQALKVDRQAPVLDLACGNGRNGLFLIKNDINVSFSDINDESLKQINKTLRSVSVDKQALAQYWQIDFEQANITPLQDKTFAAIMVFRYLHRPLFEQIKAAIKPGGMIFYETFTKQQAQYGRPKNPDFLLKPDELLEQFSHWKILHRFEGVVNVSANDVSAHSNTKQAIAQIVAIKPE